MTTTIHPHGHTAIPTDRATSTAGYLLERGLYPYEVIEALVSELGISIADAFEATDTAMNARGGAVTAAHA